MNPTLNLSDAISAVEQTENARAAVVAKRSSDQAAADTAQQKADAAKSIVTQDASDEQAAVTAEVAALSGLKDAIDAKIASLQPPAPQPPAPEGV